MLSPSKCEIDYRFASTILTSNPYPPAGNEPVKPLKFPWAFNEFA
jgi:hypothetical protein